MARSAPSISSFVAGEISPRLEGRTELDKYRAGLSELLNMVVHPHGGVSRRPGTEFLGEVKNSATKTRLIPFQFKTSDTYILVFGDSMLGGCGGGFGGWCGCFFFVWACCVLFWFGVGGCGCCVFVCGVGWACRWPRKS